MCIRDSGLSDFDEQKFIKTLIAAKLIMMLGLSLFGKTLSISCLLYTSRCV